MTDPDNTTAEILMRAAAIGSRSGLRYVYAGNLPGEVGNLENTHCHNCQQMLIERYGYLIIGYHLTSNGCCPSCATGVPGRWACEFQDKSLPIPFCRCAFPFVLYPPYFGVDLSPVSRQQPRSG